MATPAENDAARERFSKAYAVLSSEFDDILVAVLQGTFPQFIGKYPQSIDVRVQEALKKENLQFKDLHILSEKEKTA